MLKDGKSVRFIVVCIVILLALYGCENNPAPSDDSKPVESQSTSTYRTDLLQTQQSKTTLALTKVFFLDANEGWAVGRNGVILHTGNGGGDWSPQPSSTDENLIDIQFINKTTGWAVSVNRVLSTSNGGRTWSDVWDTSTINLSEGESGADTGIQFQAAMISIAFYDANHGWALALGWDPSAGKYSTPLVLNTNDAGKSWDWQVIDQEYGLIAVADSKTCIIAGKLGRLAQTTDGGKTWERRSSLTEDDILGVSFSSPKQGWAVGSHGTIISSNDGGRTWEVVYKQSDNDHPIELHAIHFNDQSHGAAAGFEDISKGDKYQYLLTTLVTTNGGRDWQRKQIAPVDFVINSMSIINPGAAWAAGGAGQIVRFRTE
ncbi:MAG TPA: YCF48-related protein [Blastocatellia bacterium]|nr:YCF48-related protein [Blastocatellia bacterium]